MVLDIKVVRIKKVILLNRTGSIGFLADRFHSDDLLLFGKGCLEKILDNH